MTKKILAALLLFLILTNSLTCLADTTQAEATLEITNVTIREPVRVEIYLDPSIEPYVLEGTIIRIKSKIYNAEGAKSFTYNWYIDRNDGNGYVLIQLATQDHYDFAASKETLSWSFKLIVDIEW